MTVAEIYNLTNTLLRKEIKGNTFSPNELNIVFKDVNDRFFRDKAEEYFSKNQNPSPDDIYSSRLLSPFTVVEDGVSPSSDGYFTLNKEQLLPPILYATNSSSIAISLALSNIDISLDTVVLERDTNSNFSTAVPVEEYTSPNLTVIDTSLSASTEYFYRAKVQRDGFDDSNYAYLRIRTSISPAPFPRFYPYNYTSNVNLDSNITITFDVPIRNTDASEITDANVANLITLKYNSSTGTNITFTAAINSSKTIITITPESIEQDSVIYMEVDGYETTLGTENTYAVSSLFTTAGYYNFINRTDYAYWIGAYDVTSNKQINLVKEETLNSRLMSLLDDPLEYYPVSVIRGDNAYIYPSNLADITLVYIRYALTPVYDYYIDVNGNYVALASGAVHTWVTGEIDSNGVSHTTGDADYNSTTQELEYDMDIHPEFATRVLERAGVRMTNDMLTQYGLMKKQEEKAV